MRNLFLKFIPLLIIGSVILAGCKKKDDTEEEEEIPEQPALPPENAFINDFSEMSDTNAARSAEAFIYSAIGVAYWNAALFLTFSVPVAAWHEVREVEPYYDFDLRAWVWERAFDLPSGDYTARLEGRMNGTEVNWKMHLSKAGGFQDFLWYEGDAKVDITEGNWTLYRSVANPEPYIEIDWENNLSSEVGDNIKYTNVVPNDSANGGYIHYGILDDPEYDVYYDLYGAREDRLVEIDFDRTTTAGRVRDETYFGDAGWHCWDETKQDVTCP